MCWLREVSQSSNPLLYLVVMGLPAYKFEGLDRLGDGLIGSMGHTDLGCLSPMHATARRTATRSHDMVRHWPSLTRRPIHLNQHAKIEVVVLGHSRSVIMRGMKVPRDMHPEGFVVTCLAAQPGGTPMIGNSDSDMQCRSA